MKREKIRPEAIYTPDHRESHAPYQQTASCHPTFVSAVGAGTPRFPSDRMILSGRTVTKEQYDEFWEKLSESA